LAGKITALEAQPKSRERVGVYLDGAYAFGLQAIVAATLRLGQSLSDEQIADLRQRDARERVYDQALLLLSYRPRSMEEVRLYLASKQVPEGLIAETVARLAQAGLVDDQAFASYWVENRESFRPRGLAALRQELRRKGVDPEAIEAALSSVDEESSAYRVARPLALRLGHADRETFRRKLGGYLTRRGFTYETTRETVERLWRERGAHDEG